MLRNAALLTCLLWRYFSGDGCNHPLTHTQTPKGGGHGSVCATPAVESPGSCREGAGSIPAVRVAPLPKRRLQVPGCSECAPHAAGFKTRKPRALPEGAVVRFLWLVSGVGVARKSSEAHLPLPVDPVPRVLL